MKTSTSISHDSARPTSNGSSEHVDVLIVGAGLSGIGAACKLSRECPDRTFAVVEARQASGGTWDLFRYPGVRSDSDMFTMAYSFQPWTRPAAMVGGSEILEYIRDAAREHGVADRVRYGRRVVAAHWSSVDARWRVEIERTDTGHREALSCGFLFACPGYYDHDEGYTPGLAGRDRFAGRVVHPQHWPEDLDHEGLRVIVIGSGATAVTLVPALAARAAHVTMLQRSPSYVISLPRIDPLARALRWLPADLRFRLTRRCNIRFASGFYRFCRRFPRLAKAILRRGVSRRLPKGWDVDTHFAPRYEPWDQRLCIVPDGDLFESIARGDASIVTDEIESFTEAGVRLASGRELEADLIVTATGLNIVPIGGIELNVDGRRIELDQTVGYKGAMLSGVPNFAFTIGYTNASWTLKAELVADYVCRLLVRMERRGLQVCTPAAPDSTEPTQPFIDLTSGYIARGIDQFPRQGSRTPWRLHQDYARDVGLLRHGPIEDGTIEFSGPASSPRKSTIASLEADRLAGHPGRPSPALGGGR